MRKYSATCLNTADLYFLLVCEVVIITLISWKAGIDTNSKNEDSNFPSHVKNDGKNEMFPINVVQMV